MKTEKLPNGAVMTAEQAEIEVNKWFDFRKVKPKARDNYNEEVGKDALLEKMIEGFEYGLLIFDPEKGYLKQKLEFPYQSENGGVKISELDWKPRFREKELAEPLKGVKPNDREGRMKAHVAAITGIDRSFIGSLDYSDWSLSSTIVSYFL